MKLKKLYSEKKYDRKIEGMGKGLVLFEISAVDKRVGQNYHLFYENKRKPPLDIAINPEDGTIEYISYFIQDEIKNNTSSIPVIETEDTGISIYDSDFNENNPNITKEGYFRFWKEKNTILILEDEIIEHELNAYKIDDSNDLLFSGEKFVGVQFKNLNQKEILEIQNSNCLVKIEEECLKK